MSSTTSKIIKESKFKEFSRVLPDLTCETSNARAKIGRYNRDFAVRRADVIDDDVENWTKKKKDAVKGRGRVICAHVRLRHCQFVFLF